LHFPGVNIKSNILQLFRWLKCQSQKSAKEQRRIYKKPIETMDNIDEVKPYIKDSDTQINVVFKAGFYACIKAVEDQGNDLLVSDLKDILNKM